MITRYLKNECINGIKKNPVTAILGPRQCGKTTLAKEILKHFEDYVYLDLERPSDLAKLENAEWFFQHQQGKLLCMDEIQRKPDIFPLIRSIVDSNGTNKQFLILGSATNELLKQSSESLAGRITYKSLSPFLINEIKTGSTLENLILKGGFPRSFLAKSLKDSFQWREDFITTYLERDIHQWVGNSSISIRRILTMLSHHNGQTINYSAIGNSLSISNVTIRNYIDIMAGTFMLDVVQPLLANSGKRLIKAPKIYFRDSGILTTLLNLDSFNKMCGHPSFGSIWETVVLANLRGNFPKAEINFFRTLHGAELDFVINQNNKSIGIECKTNINPILSKGNYISIQDISPVKTFVIAPVKDAWEHNKNIIVTPLSDAIKSIRKIIET
jgi:predicted AAA+ superfamily ATPase